MCYQPAKDAASDKRLQKFQNDAMHCFKSCIGLRHGSVHAAHGVAAVQASRGDLATAARILAKVLLWTTLQLPCQEAVCMAYGSGSCSQSSEETGRPALCDSLLEYG